MTLERVLELLFGNLGLLVALMFILVGGHRGWWVWGWVLKDAVTTCDSSAKEMQKELRSQITKLENRLTQSERLSERGTGLARQAIERAERNVDSADR